MKNLLNKKYNFAKATGVCGYAYFLENEDYIISGSLEGFIKIVNLKNSTYLREFKFENTYNHFILSQDKKYIFLLGNNPNRIEMIEILTGQIKKTFINEITVNEPNLFFVDSKLNNLF